MASSALSNLQVVTEFKNNLEINLAIPQVVLGPWELIDFAYHKSSALPVSITLMWKIKRNGQVFYKIREELNFIGNDLYFQINKDMQSEWEITLSTIGAAGNNFNHWASITYR